MQKRAIVITSAAIAATSGVAAYGQAQFTPLGDLPGGSFEHSQAWDVSDDGTIVTGGVNIQIPYVDPGGAGFRWTAATGMVALADIPEGEERSSSTAISGNGAFMCGHGRYSTRDGRAVRWSSPSTFIDLPFLGLAFNSHAHDLNADGSVMVGAETLTSNRAWRWTPTSYDFLPAPMGFSVTRAVAVDALGSVIVGSAQISDSPASSLFGARWQGGTVELLSDLPGGANRSAALGVSADGTVIVGYGTSDRGTVAVYWTDASGIVSMGDLRGEDRSSRALAASGDGSIIVGESATDEGLRAFVWTAASGMRPLSDLLEAGGADLMGYTLERARSITPDGRFVVGDAIRPDGAKEGFIARLVLCRADLDGDGDLTFFDFLTFQNLFAAGDPRADFDASGALDFFDFLAFQTEFAAGCP